MIYITHIVYESASRFGLRTRSSYLWCSNKQYEFNNAQSSTFSIIIIGAYSKRPVTAAAVTRTYALVHLM